MVLVITPQGTKRTLPETNYPGVARQLAKHNIQGLLVIGGFEAFQTVMQLAEKR